MKKAMNTTRAKSALRLRQKALELLEKQSAFAPCGPMRVLQTTMGPFDILYRTPFQKLPRESEYLRYMRAVLGAKENLPYGIDIWRQRKKVLNVEWDGNGEVQIICYKRGSWEEEFLQTGGPRMTAKTGDV